MTLRGAVVGHWLMSIEYMSGGSGGSELFLKGCCRQSLAEIRLFSVPVRYDLKNERELLGGGVEGQ